MTKLLIKLFIKDYDNIGNFKVRENYGKFASVVGIATNFLLFFIKIVTGVVFNSIAIIADAVNNLSDSTSSLVTLIGFKISGKPADSEHPYGHARIEYVSGLLVSFSIIFLGFLLIQSSFDKILHPAPAQSSFIMVFILVASILIKVWQSMFYKKIGKTIDSITIMAVSVDSGNDVLATSAILIGLAITYFTGFNLDGYMGIAVALFILYSGVKLVLATTNPLLGMAPSQEMVDTISRKILNYEKIIGIHDLNVHNYGVGRCYASVHCEVPAEIDIMVSHEIIDQIERDFHENDDIHLVIHLDPVVTNDERTNALKDEIQTLVSAISEEMSIHDFRVVWGINSSKIIFDIAVPYGLNREDEELISVVSEGVMKLNKTYHTLIIIDRH